MTPLQQAGAHSISSMSAQHSSATAQHSSALHSSAQSSTAQHQLTVSTAQHIIAQQQLSTVQHSTSQLNTAQHNTAQHGTIEHFWCCIVSSAFFATVVTLRSLWQGVVPRSVGCFVLHLKVKALSRGQIQQAFMCTCPGLDLLISFFQPRAL